MVGVLKFENKPLRTRWYLLNPRYTTYHYWIVLVVTLHFSIKKKRKKTFSERKLLCTGRPFPEVIHSIDLRKPYD